jgi:hypothetical protein
MQPKRHRKVLNPIQLSKRNHSLTLPDSTKPQRSLSMAYQLAAQRQHSAIWAVFGT